MTRQLQKYLTHVLLLGFAMANSAFAEDAIETTSFTYVLPTGWKANLRSRPVSAKGPNGELLQLSVSSVTESGSPAEAEKVLRQVEANASKSMLEAAADSKLTTTMALKKSKLENEVTFHEIVSRTKDGAVVFAQYSATGPRSVLLATLEAPASSASASAARVRESLTQIKWRP
jgi:hypothetical protein